MKETSHIFIVLSLAFWISTGSTCKEVASDAPGHLVPLTELPAPLKECSGMVSLGNNQFVAHNDSGNKSLLYVFSIKDPQIVRQVFVAEAPNKDWEDLAADDKYLYISDTGNNNGKRTNLRIFRVLISEVLAKDTIHAGVIQFAYEDQVKFGETKFHNYDCEALICKGDSLYLFTKNRGDFRTNVYGIPKVPGRYTARISGSFDTRGLVTGADFRHTKAGGELALVGYSVHGKAFYPFVVYFPQVSEVGFFTDDYKRWDYRQVLQTESIVFHDQEVYISNEEEDDQQGFIYKIKLREP